MKNTSDLRTMFHSMAVEIYGIERANDMWDEMEEILGGTEVFELGGFSGIGYMVYRDGDQGWTWKSYETGEDDIYGDNYGTRADAMIAAAFDADLNVYDYVDSQIGDRIREAI